MIYRPSWLAALVFTAALQAATPPLLDQAVQQWNAGKDDWAFTQRARTFDDDGKLLQERLERFDPSHPDNQRWHLLEINGKPPTQDELQQWQVRKNQKPRQAATRPLNELFDFEGASLQGETPQAATYAVAVRPVLAHLVAVEKLVVEFTVNKQTKAIEHVTAGLSEPMRVALGLAKVTDVDLDLTFDAPVSEGPSASSEVTTNGTATMSMSKVVGARIEYVWSDFRRVSRHVAGKNP